MNSIHSITLIKLTINVVHDPNGFFFPASGLFSLGTIFSLVTNGAGFQEKFPRLKQHIVGFNGIRLVDD